MKFAAVFALSAIATAAAAPGAICGTKDGMFTRESKENCDLTKEFCSVLTLKCTTYIAHDAVCGLENDAVSMNDERGVCVDTDLCSGDADTDKCITLPKKGEACIKETGVFGTNTCGPTAVTPLKCDQFNATHTDVICKEGGQPDGSFCNTNMKGICAGWCDRTVKACKPYGKTGDECTSSDTCEDRCDTTTTPGKCAKYKNEGATCSVPAECCPFSLMMAGCSCDGIAPNKVCKMGQGLVTFKSSCGKTANWAAETERCVKFESTAAVCNAAGGCFYCTSGDPDESKCQWAPTATCKVEQSSPLAPGMAAVTTYSAGMCNTVAMGTLSGAGTVTPALAVLAVLSAAAAAFSK